MALESSRQWTLAYCPNIYYSMHSHCRHGAMPDAHKLLNLMVERGEKPNIITHNVYEEFNEEARLLSSMGHQGLRASPLTMLCKKFNNF